MGSECGQCPPCRTNKVDLRYNRILVSESLQTLGCTQMVRLQVAFLLTEKSEPPSSASHGQSSALLMAGWVSFFGAKIFLL